MQRLPSYGKGSVARLVSKVVSRIIISYLLRGKVRDGASLFATVPEPLDEYISVDTNSYSIVSKHYLRQSLISSAAGSDCPM
jgi:hypothetical protein